MRRPRAGWLAAMVAVLFLSVGVLASASCGDDDEPERLRRLLRRRKPSLIPRPTRIRRRSADAHEKPVDGVVNAKSEDATQVDVVLREWEVAPASGLGSAGNVYFLVENEGPEDAHEFAIARTSRVDRRAADCGWQGGRIAGQCHRRDRAIQSEDDRLRLSWNSKRATTCCSATSPRKRAVKWRATSSWG